MYLLEQAVLVFRLLALLEHLFQFMELELLVLLQTAL